MATNRPPSQRQLRVGELIRHELAALFLRGETGDPEIERSGVTVTEVQASPDLRNATAFVRPLRDDASEPLLQALARNRKRIRKLLAPKLGLRYMPDVSFRIDTAIDYASSIEDLLKDPKVQQDLRRPPADEG